MVKVSINLKQVFMLFINISFYLMMNFPQQEVFT